MFETNFNKLLCRVHPFSFLFLPCLPFFSTIGTGEGYLDNPVWGLKAGMHGLLAKEVDSIKGGGR